jgi:hypothetical protein
MLNLKLVTMKNVDVKNNTINASEMTTEEQIAMYKKSILDTKEELDEMYTESNYIGSKVGGHPCSCTEDEFLPDENQWEPGHTCDLHKDLEYVEHTILCAKEYLANLERSLAIAEYQPL